MKILAFAASNSSQSINKRLVAYASTLLDKHDVEILDINDYEMPIYSHDLEQADGIPDAASKFLDKIAASDGLLISFAEHNGNYTVAYKNLFDWTSRLTQAVYQEKPIVMLSTSPGQGGAKSVLGLASDSAHFFKGKVKATLSVPGFHDNFDPDKGGTGELTNPELVEQLQAALAAFEG